ncbi:ArsB/NhaD family transporter [Candidatus Aerophobetes bacterium]|nr:ArsB/NhaD family transporter [Candidatus Aerophobetes bacterium]
MADMVNVAGSILIFVVCFCFFIQGKVHRTVVSMVGAGAMLIFGTIRGFYLQSTAFGEIDFNTIGLLVGMMIIVAVLRRSGFFRYVAIKGVKLAKGDPWKLLVALGLITGFISMIIDNVTTILLVSPLTLLISDILGINPLPLLIGEVVLSNIGGVATMVGDPPNIMIASASGLTFNSFILHLMPVSVCAGIVSIVFFKIIFSSSLRRKEDRIRKLSQLREEGSIKDKKVLLNCIISLSLVFSLFATEEVHHLKPAFVALLGATITLVIVGRGEVESILSEIEWSVLFFFASLFVIVGGVDQAGFLELIGRALTGVSSNPLILALVIMWLSAIFSAFVDNIPCTAAMIPVIKHLGAMGVDINPLWWALAIGAGFGGNGTPIGSSAGVIVMGITDKTSYPIDLKMWIRSAGVATLLTTGLASLFFILGFSFFS